MSRVEGHVLPLGQSWTSQDGWKRNPRVEDDDQWNTLQRLGTYPLAMRPRPLRGLEKGLANNREGEEG